MLLLHIFQAKKLNYVLLFVAVASIGVVNTTDTNETTKLQANEKTPVVVVLQQKSVKKDLKVNIANETNAKDDQHIQKLTPTEEETSVVETSGKLQEQQTLQKDGDKINILETGTKPSFVQPQLNQHHVDENFTFNDEDNISQSLKASFYFFLIVSSGAIVFIIFKIYRLRLSRAERRYGVQGDRSTQELTPLPISIEDGNSDDEDQTLFDIQNQNIRIL